MSILTPVDPKTVEWSPGPMVELAPEVIALRAVVESAGRALLTVPDDRLEALWPWPGSSSEVDVRYGFFRLFELFETSRAAVAAALAAAGVAPAPGGGRGAASTVARWSLHGLLLPLGDAALDRDPGDDEWPIRETMGHVLTSQRFYSRFTLWWLTQAPTPAAIPSDELSADVPERSVEAAGSMDDVRRRLDELLDLSMACLGGLSAEQLAVPARWSGGEVTVGFRIGRWASHIREHTIQVEKTLVMLDRPIPEVERLIRMGLEAYGRLEETVFGVPAADVERSGAGAVLNATAEEVGRLVPSIVEAAAT
ncbi:MAG TPA: DinB family protein [Candidatus Limnocylindrales bacterium]|nr:DinB family protein [Candidatus Limnocylindrales bacterium]